MTEQLKAEGRPRDVTDWLVGGGEMGQLIRSMDWSGTPLGPIERWPQSLRTTISLALASNFPISIAWGPEHIQLYNDGYRVVCGSAHPRVMGVPFNEAWESAWPSIGESFERALAGQTSYLENVRMFLERNGYSEETFFTFSFSPIRDESGKVGGLFHPVTETTQAMLAQRRTRALRDLAAHTGDAKSPAEALAQASGVLAESEADLPFVRVYTVSSDGKAKVDDILGDATTVQLVDAKAFLVDEMTGPYPEPPAKAMVLPLFMPGATKPTGVMVAGLSPRLPLTDEYRGFCEQAAAAVSAAVASATAYQEERHRAEMLAELDRAKTTFFSNVSHEFRTPLSLMLGPVEDGLADEREPLPPGQRERQETVHRNALRLLKLVNTLLDFSRVEAGRATATFEPTDIAAFTAELASSFRSAIEQAGLTLDLDCPPLSSMFGVAYLDRAMWEQVILNLLSNALKHTFAGGISVCVHAATSARDESPTVCIEVADTGTGIPAEQMPHMFERFFRVPNAKSRTHEGSGIGLALVQELVKLHGGTISLASVEAKGTTFTVQLPLKPGVVAADNPSRSNGHTPHRGAAAPYIAEALRWVPEGSRHSGPVAVVEDGVTGSVLVVDDNADMREYITRLLRDDGWHVNGAPDGRAALELLTSSSAYDLVLSDVMMPHLDGFGLLQALRADERTRHLPVILLSARAGEDSRVEGLDAGADDYLVKPFTARELLARARSNLSLARMRHDLMERDRLLSELAQRQHDLESQAVELENQTEEAQALTEEIEQTNAELMTRIEEAVRSAHIAADADARLKFALHAAQLGTWDMDLITQRATRTPLHDRAFGYDELLSEWTYEMFLQHVHPEDRAEVDERFRATMATGVPWNFETRVVWPDGSVHWVQAFSEVYHDHGGRPVRLLGSVQDVTERTESRRAAEAANAAKSEFLAAMSHELRTPLNAIGGYADLMEMELRGPISVEQRADLQRIKHSQQYLLSIINDILNFAKLDAARVQFRTAAIGVDALVRDTESMISPQVAARGLDYSYHGCDASLIVRADRDKMQQIVLNLFANAIKFTAPGGRIRVSCSRDGHSIAICVKDTGTGIAAEHVDRIFEPFVQIERRLNRPVEGTGLGLAISRELARGMGGDITVESEPGVGSSFTLTLPSAE